MGYEESLREAGAEVLEFKSFGDYQGTWWALVEYRGQKGWVQGSYGSCSGCDSFQAEFGYTYHAHFDRDYYDPLWEGFVGSCERCQEVKQRIIEFGESYLDNMLSQDEAVKEASRYIEWDYDARLAVDFINEHSF